MFSNQWTLMHENEREADFSKSQWSRGRWLLQAFVGRDDERLKSHEKYKYTFFFG